MTKYATTSAFIGFRGDSVWVGGGEPWPDDHPLVVARPDLFTDTPPGEEPVPPKRGPGRPPKPRPDVAGSSGG